MSKDSRLSKKRESELYDLIHADIMKVRIDFQRMLTDEHSRKYVDAVLSKLCYQTAQKAIDLFKVNHTKTIQNG